MPQFVKIMANVNLLCFYSSFYVVHENHIVLFVRESFKCTIVKKDSHLDNLALGFLLLLDGFSDNFLHV